MIPKTPEGGTLMIIEQEDVLLLGQGFLDGVVENDADNLNLLHRSSVVVYSKAPTKRSVYRFHLVRHIQSSANTKMYGVIGMHRKVTFEALKLSK